MFMFANNALLGGGVRVRVWIREQRKIKRRSKAPLSLFLMANLGSFNIVPEDIGIQKHNTILMLFCCESIGLYAVTAAV